MIASGWNDHVVPRLVEAALSERFTAGWREHALSGASGRVVEVGFGSGTNLSHYGDHVTEVLAVEPSEVAWARSEGRRGAFRRPVTRIGLDGASIGLDDATVDSVVTTWTMCTIPDLTAALDECARVLKPGARLHFVEHSLSPEPAVSRIQQRLQRAWGPVAGGCHLTRDIRAELEDAGFEVEGTARYATRFAPAKPFAWFVMGTAIKPFDH